MLSNATIILCLCLLALNGQPSFAEEGLSGDSIPEAVLREDREIIKNLDFLQDYEIIQDADAALLEDYDDIENLDNDEEESNE